MISCVYRIRNRVTGEVYIGSTINLYQRVYAHLTKLRAGTHTNSKLQRAWIAYGKGSFSFGILEVTPRTNEALLEAETRWMAVLRPRVPAFYNRWSPKQGRCRPFKDPDA